MQEWVHKGLCNYLYAITPVIASVALASACSTQPLAVMSLKGSVLTEAGTPIAGALVSIGATSVHSANDGSFTLSVKDAKGVLIAKAAGFSDFARPVDLGEAGVWVNTIHLRAFDRVVTVTLPTNGEPVSITATRGDAQSTLSISPNTMVLPSGEVAQGNVQVTISFWHPLQDLGSAPGPLVAASSTDGVSTYWLKSYGMADIQVSQDGQLLQVAPGKTLQWQVVEPVAMSNAIASLPSAQAPQLYYLNMQNGLWTRDGDLAYDAASHTFTATLPHLTSWNIDGAEAYYGGCTTGRVVNKCNKPLANHVVKVWFYEAEEVAMFPGKSDSRGNFCINTPSRYDSTDPSANLTHYYLSGRYYPNIKGTTHYWPHHPLTDNASSCRPIPQYCVKDSATTTWPFTVQHYDNCKYNPSDQFWPSNARSCADSGSHPRVGTAPYGIEVSECDNDCGTAENWIIKVPNCAVCPGTNINTLNGSTVCNGRITTNVANCAHTQDLVVDDGTSCQQSTTTTGSTSGRATTGSTTASGSTTGGGTTSSTTGGSTTGSSTGGKKTCTPQPAGTPCNTTADCCDYPTLICADSLCVPNNGQ